MESQLVLPVLNLPIKPKTYLERFQKLSWASLSFSIRLRVFLNQVTVVFKRQPLVVQEEQVYSLYINMQGIMHNFYL